MFPVFNGQSTPLLILALQGLLFALLLLNRFWKKSNFSDLFLGLILLTTCYSQTCYTLGFMEWYDTFKTTKINYFLYNITIPLAPLIYFYTKSITQSKFNFKKQDWLHFIPSILIIVYRIGIYIYDANQPNFQEVQNGPLKISFDETIFQKVMQFIEFPLMLLYLAFTLQLFYNYRKKIIHYFSNTYKLELNWVLSFLILFTIGFLYDSIQTIIGSYITDLNYKDRWWLNFYMALVTLYVGVKGYLIDTSKLKKLDFSFSPSRITIPDVEETYEIKSISDNEISTVIRLMETDKVFLNPELNLSDLAKQANMGRAQLSEVINNGIGKNFNDFVNEYRVNAFKSMLKDGKHKQLSLLGIAFECGFNSKATFNRVFKKLTNASPTQYLKSEVI